MGVQDASRNRIKPIGFWVMELLPLLSRLLPLLGSIRGAAAVWRAHESRAEARAVADAPTTKVGLEDTLRKGEL